jgi:hypothetical protein
VVIVDVLKNPWDKAKVCSVNHNEDQNPSKEVVNKRG